MPIAMLARGTGAICYHTNYVFNADSEADDYLVTLPILLEAGKNYNVVINAYGMSSKTT